MLRRRYQYIHTTVILHQFHHSPASCTLCASQEVGSCDSYFRIYINFTIHVHNTLQWVPEITHQYPKTPFLLVGTQTELRDDPATIEKLSKVKQKPITVESAEKRARIEGSKVCRMLSFDTKWIDKINVFDEASSVALAPPEHCKECLII